MLPICCNLHRTYMTLIAILNPLLTWNFTSLNSIVCIPQENWNLRIPSSRYRYIYMSGVRWAYSKMPVAATVRAVTSMWVPELLASLWLRYDCLAKAATLIPACSSHSTPFQPNLHTHCNTTDSFSATLIKHSGIWGSYSRVTEYWSLLVQDAVLLLVWFSSTSWPGYSEGPTVLQNVRNCVAFWRSMT